MLVNVPSATAAGTQVPTQPLFTHVTIFLTILELTIVFVSLYIEQVMSHSNNTPTVSEEIKSMVLVCEVDLYEWLPTSASAFTL